jgi:hypothetical protein
MLGIILGVFGILNEVGNLFYPLLRPAMIELMERTTPPGVMESIVGFLPPAIVIMLSAVAELSMAILLLVGGVHLRRRRPIGAKLVRLWGIIRIPWTVLEVGLANFILRRMLPAFSHLSEYGEPSEWVLGVGMTAGLLFGLAVPVFVLVWFSRGSIAAEVAGWSAPVGQPG